jgi:MFS family permease
VSRSAPEAEGGLDPRYLIVFGACLVQFTVIGLLFSFGLFVKVFETEFGWSRTFVSSCSSLAFFTMGVLAIWGGRLNDRYGPRVVLAVSGVTYAVGWGLMAWIDAPWQLLVLSLLLGVGMSTHDVVTLSTIARWFSARRGIMTGVVKVGTAAGQVTLPPLIAMLIAWLGWRDALATIGVGAGALLLLAASQMALPAADPAGAPPQAGVAYAEARRSRIFWTLCAMQFLFFPSLMTVPLHIAVHGQDIGMTPAVAAGLLSVIGAASVAGRLTVGGFSDRLGGRNAYALCFTPLIVSLALLTFVPGQGPLFAIMALYGFAHGGFFTIVSPTVAEYFGLRAHGAIFGVVLFFGTIGGALGPILAGWSFDALGGYAPAFATLAALGAAGLGLAFTLPRRR